MMGRMARERARLLHNEEGMKTMRGVGLIAVLCVAASAMPLAQSGGAPVPRPFPGAPAPPAPAPPSPSSPTTPAPKPAPPQSPAGGTTTAPSAATPPSAPATAAASPAPALPGVPAIYPTAQYLESVDAGSGQSYYLYGADATFADVVSYYRTVLKNGGREIYRTPGMHQFDLGRFDEGKMVYPPSVVVKDYSGGSSPGYLHVSGVTEKRFRTIIQVVPPGVE
jgi:hypothetical protein